MMRKYNERRGGRRRTRTGEEEEGIKEGRKECLRETKNEFSGRTRIKLVVEVEEDYRGLQRTFIQQQTCYSCFFKNNSN